MRRSAAVNLGLSLVAQDSSTCILGGFVGGRTSIIGIEWLSAEVM